MIRRGIALILELVTVRAYVSVCGCAGVWVCGRVCPVLFKQHIVKAYWGMLLWVHGFLN